MGVWTTVDNYTVTGYQDEEDIITVQKKANVLRAIFDGPVGLETAIRFNEVDTDGHTIDFSVNKRSRGRSKESTGSIERNTDNLAQFFDKLVEQHIK